MDASIITFCHDGKSNGKLDLAPGGHYQRPSAPQTGRPRRNVADRAQMQAIGRRLNAVRGYFRLSQLAIAETVGLSQTGWSYYERGLRLPDQFEAVRLAARLGITIAFLRDGDLTGLPPELASYLAARHPEHAENPRTDRRRDKRRA